LSGRRRFRAAQPRGDGEHYSHVLIEAELDYEALLGR
jgi:hypothetical protein